MSDVVYEVARWAEVFETAESRKLKHLTWIAERCDFDSTGWQAGLEEFGPVEWPRVYGNWMILLRVAAKGKIRGRLSGDKGEAWTAFRIARPSGCDSVGINDAFNFAVKIGWLVPVETYPGDSPGNLPDIREKNTPTEHNMTSPNRTKPDRTGPDKIATGPDRAGDSSISNLKSQSSDSKADRPDAEPLHVRAKRLPLLQILSERPVKGSGIEWHGSVFGQDKLSAEHVQAATESFWIGWYQNQLTATNPVFRCGNHAELAFILAAVYAVRKCTDASLKGHKRIARMINWLKTRETSSITDAQFRRASAAIAKHFGTDDPGEKSETQNPTPENPSSPPSPAAATYKPDKAKSEAALKRIRENGLKVSGMK